MGMGEVEEHIFFKWLYSPNFVCSKFESLDNINIYKDCPYVAQGRSNYLVLFYTLNRDKIASRSPGCMGYTRYWGGQAAWNRNPLRVFFAHSLKTVII